MSRALVLCVVLAGVPVLRAAEPRTFPYEATVTVDDAPVYSGAGKRKYYATSKLKAGDTVSVHRHDPGGWYMIAPPPGSFSWVPAKSVQRTGNTGTVTGNNVSVRVGSADSDIHDVEQRRLNAGDEVTILGEASLTSSNGDAQRWYRIAPPAREWRWIQGQSVATAGQISKRKAAPAAPREVRAVEKPVETPATRTAPLRAPEFEEVDFDPDPVVATASETHSLLSALDAEMRRILSLDRSQWDFQGLDAAYREARSQTDRPGTQRLIDRRLLAIQEYSRESYAQRVIAAISEETRQRDAQLAIQQAQYESRLAGGRGRPQPTLVQKVAPRFDGAGIVQNSPAGSPSPYVLMAPDGRVLAFLTPQGAVDPSVFVGKPAGVRGTRVHRADLRTDEILVTSLVLVRLQ